MNTSIVFYSQLQLLEQREHSAGPTYKAVLRATMVLGT